MKSEVISAIAACIAVIMAFVSWYYNKEITTGKLSLNDVKIEYNRRQEKLQINFIFHLKNTGQHPLEIKKIQLGHYDFKNKIFENISKPSVINDIYSQSIFNYSNSFSTEIPNIPDKEIPTILPTIIGEHSIILIIQYKVKSFFSFGTKTLKSYLGYKGHAAVYQLTVDDYNLMKEKLPNEFKK